MNRKHWPFADPKTDAEFDAVRDHLLNEIEVNASRAERLAYISLGFGGLALAALALKAALALT